MDPLSLGIAAAALIATKGAEAFAAKAGEGLWKVVGRIYDTIAESLTGKDEQLALEAVASASAHPAEMEAKLAKMIADRASESDAFCQQIASLVAEAKQDAAGSSIVANAFDQAKQVNFGGDNFGPISL